MNEKIQSIKKLREQNEPSEIICIREINQNIKNIFEGKPLTRPLRMLNKSCEFKKRYDIAFDLTNEDKIKKEVKKRMREYNKEYYQKPEVKKRMREYNREYMRKKLKIPENRWKVKENEK